MNLHVEISADELLDKLTILDIKSERIVDPETLPAVAEQALRDYFPNAELTRSVISHYQHGTPEDLLDRVHVVPGRKEKSGVRATLAAYRDPGEQDVLFDLTSYISIFLHQIHILNH